MPGENEAPAASDPAAALQRALSLSRVLALADMGLAGVWCGAGVVLRMAGWPWSSEQFMSMWFPLLAGISVCGLVVLFWSGVQIDKHRAAKSALLLRSMRRATAGGVIAGIASLGVLWPRIVEISFNPGAPTISGSNEGDLAAGIAFGLIPLLLGVANGFVAMAFGAQFRELEA